jgi:glycogen debranching enzyme
MYDGATLPVRIQHPDNPPLFAWTEEEYVRHTGDLDRVRWLLGAGYLQQRFRFFDEVARGSTFPSSNVPTQIERTERGYRWNGVCSGMDNTPRGSEQGDGGTWGNILWFDAAAQQALSARSIARLARLVDDEDLARTYDAEHARLVALVDDYWDERDGIYYDRADSAPFAFHRVRTPAAYWPLLAGACSPDQAAALATLLTDPACFGGPVPWPSVARDDPAFRGSGHYWRGGVWVPVAYVSARALADHGYPDLAARASRALLDHMSATFRDYEPASIWEAYAPSRATPATGKDDAYLVRPDFCGWSALAPISMLLEHVLGFRVDALTRSVTWRRPAARAGGRAGVRRLRCGDVTLSAVDDGAGTVTLDSDGPVTVVVDGRSVEVVAGSQTVLREPEPRPGVR